MTPVKDEKGGAPQAVMAKEPHSKSEGDTAEAPSTESEEFGLDRTLSDQVARPTARSEAMEIKGEALHCIMCRNLAPVNPTRSGWVLCPRCYAQPSIEGSRD